MKVGFIGLGTMGAFMAANVQKTNHAMIVHDIRREAAEPFIKAGAEWADSPKALASECDVVFASLPGPPEVEAVALGEDGLIHGLKPGAAFFDLSTNSTAMVRHIHTAFEAAGLHMLDAPVSGGPAGAKSGKLAILVGGACSVFDQFESVLQTMSDQPRYIGEIGAGTVAKLVHNCAGYMIQTVLAEVFTMGVKAGVEPIALWETVRQCAIGRRRTLDGMADQYLLDTYDPPAFALKLAHKDVTLATALGREVGVPMRMANLTLAELTEAMQRDGWPEQDSRIAMRLQNERAGVTVAADRKSIAAVFERDPKAPTQA